MAGGVHVVALMVWKWRCQCRLFMFSRVARESSDERRGLCGFYPQRTRTTATLVPVLHLVLGGGGYGAGHTATARMPAHI